MRYPNKVITRDQLKEHVWSHEFSPSGNHLDVYIRYLRRKVDSGHKKKLIHTIRGVGYKIMK